jgi:ubiquinol-cytochrome c reductase cytochrome b/c1 subunit
VKDSFMMVCFCVVFAWFVFYMPNYMGHADNYIPANPAVTPQHIVPEWYYLPFYAILRAIPNKLMGVIALFGSIGILAFLPWLDTSRVRSANYRPLYRQFFWIFVAGCQARGRRLCRRSPHPDLLLLRALLHHPAGARLGREDQAAAELDIGVDPGFVGQGARLRVGENIMSRTILALALAGSLLGLSTATSFAAGEAPVPPRQKWSFAGPFGQFDKGQLQRGFKVYREVCGVCHGLNLLSFRNLTEIGFSEGQVKTIAAEYKVQDGPNDQGEMFEREGRPADRFPPPWPNENAARVRYNGVPPDFSVLAKARGYERGFPWFIFDVFTQFQEQGVDYIHALLVGYEDKPPQGFQLPPGSFYNKYFPGHAIAMPPPLTDKRVDYTDGSPTTVEQYSRDVTAFMMWAAEPTMEKRKRIGFQVMIFLLVFAGLLYFTKKKVWADAH